MFHHAWTCFHPTLVDIGIYVGTIGIFFVCILFMQELPSNCQAELKTILKSSGANFKKLRAEHGDDAKQEHLEFSTKNKNN